MDAKQQAMMQQFWETMQADDARLSEQQKGHMRLMIEQGVPEREAKMRVMTIGATPDYQGPVPPPWQPFPKSLYHKDGRIQVCKDEANLEAALAAGWTEKPTHTHVQAQLHADQKRNNIALADIPVTAGLAVEKQRKASATN
jgi:hypothetical protein